MEYLSVEQARDMSGLRLVLTAGHPGPWGEAVKAMLKIKGVAYTAVRQEAGGENAGLRAWTGLRNAPVAMLDDEQPVSHWMDLIFLAERLQPEPSLVPEDVELRMRMFGLIRELVGEKGFAWYRRIQLFQPLMSNPDLKPLVEHLGACYGYSDHEAEIASDRCSATLALLSEQLMQQREAGSHYFIGHRLSALDIYWATFSNMLKPLPAEQAPISDQDRQANTCTDAQILGAAHPLLFEHRDHIWSEVIGLPMDF